MPDREPAVSPSLPIGRPEDEAAGLPPRIKLEVRLFAMAKERAGRPTVAVELPLGASVADLRARSAIACRRWSLPVQNDDRR